MFKVGVETMSKRKPIKPCILVTDASSSLDCKQGFTTGDVVSFISSKYGNVGETIRSIYTALRRKVDNGLLKLTSRRYSLATGTPSLDLTRDSMSDLSQTMRRRRVCRRKSRRRKRTKSRRRKTKRRNKSASRKRKRGCRKKKGGRSVLRGRRKIKKRSCKRKPSKRKSKKISRRRCSKGKV